MFTLRRLHTLCLSLCLLSAGALLSSALTLSVGYAAPATELQAARRAAAEEAAATARAAALGDLLNSPFCPGKTLSTCTSPQAFELRQEMQALIRAGKSDEEVLARLRSAFDLMQLEPPPQPWYVMLVPILPFVLGGLLALWFFARWRDPKERLSKGAQAGRGEEHDDEESEREEARAARLDALLKEDN